MRRPRGNSARGEASQRGADRFTCADRNQLRAPICETLGDGLTGAFRECNRGCECDRVFDRDHLRVPIGEAERNALNGAVR